MILFVFQISSLSVDCIDVYDAVVSRTCDEIDTNIKVSIRYSMLQVVSSPVSTNAKLIGSFLFLCHYVLKIHSLLQRRFFVAANLCLTCFLRQILDGVHDDG